MMELFQKQAERFGTERADRGRHEVDLSRRPFRVETERAFTSDALIVATGASAAGSACPPSSGSMNRGVSACATCDGALYRGKPMAVVGGGDTAMEEALFLTRFGTKVTVIHRRDELRASKIMQERALANEKIEFLWNSVVEEVLGDEFVTGVRVRDVKTGELRDLPVEALFVAIGHKPNTELFRGQLDLTRWATSGSSRAPRRASRGRVRLRRRHGPESTGRRSPPRAPAAWRRSTRSAGSPSGVGTGCRLGGCGRAAGVRLGCDEPLNRRRSSG
jgi:thioredoxin reductase